MVVVLEVAVAVFVVVVVVFFFFLLEWVIFWLCAWDFKKKYLYYKAELVHAEKKRSEFSYTDC